MSVEIIEFYLPKLYLVPYMVLDLRRIIIPVNLFLKEEELITVRSRGAQINASGLRITEWSRVQSPTASISAKVWKSVFNCEPNTLIRYN